MILEYSTGSHTGIGILSLYVKTCFLYRSCKGDQRRSLLLIIVESSLPVALSEKLVVTSRLIAIINHRTSLCFFVILWQEFSTVSSVLVQYG